MPRLNIIILDQDPSDSNTYRCVLWADVPAARQLRYANPNAVSEWPDATAADLTALRSGAVAESVKTQRVPPGQTLAQVEAFLQAQWSSYQAYINSYNPWQRYGSTWDGTTWVVMNNG